MPLRKGTLPAHLALAAALLLCACTRGPRMAAPEKAPPDAAAGATTSVPPRGEPSESGDWLVRVLDAEPDTLNPLVATDAYERQINEFIYETAVERDAATLEFVPRLAESWESSKDGLTHTFHLRHGVKFHDGTPLTAADFVYAYQRIMDPKVNAPHMRVYFQDITEFRAIDPGTLRCVYGKPYYRALEFCGSVPAIPRHVFDNGEDFNTHSAGRRPIGTGPIRFVRWDTNRLIELEANPDYYDPAKRVQFSRMIFKIITDNSVALQVFKEGEIDTVGLSAEQWMRQTGSKRFERVANKLYYDGASYSYIGWNMRREAFKDRRVRLAMTLAMPRQELVSKLFYGMARVVCSPVFYLTDYYDKNLVCEPHDPARARKLLAEAGWKDTDGDGVLDKDGKPFAFELATTAGNPVAETISTVYREELAKIGVQMSIRQLDWAAFLKKVQEWSFDACMLGWSLDVESDEYQIFHSSGAGQKGSSNHVGFVNAEADRLVEQFRVTFDKKKRIELLRRFQEIIQEEQPYTFLFSQKGRVAVNKRIANIRFYAAGPERREWYVPKGEERYAREVAP